jgi:glutathione S-transferase
MFELYHFVLATCGIKVRLVLAEKSIAYKEHLLDQDAGDLTTPEYLALNPQGMVPTLVHDDLVLVESSVIMNYLEDVDPKVSLRPESAFDRAKMNMWMKLADEVYLSALGILSYATILRPKFLAMSNDALELELAKTTDLERRAMKREVVKKGLESGLVLQALSSLSEMLDRMESFLNNSEYLAGAKYSLADSALTPFIYRLSLMGLLEQPGVQRPKLIKWWKNIQIRSSFDSTIRKRIGPEIEAMVAAVIAPILPNIYQKLSKSVSV